MPLELAVEEWPTSFKRTRMLVENPNARAIRENETRNRWVWELVLEVELAKLP